MFQIGWAEMMVIGVVALIVIGPEDLPDMFRQLGRFTAKLRSMGREFQRAMDQASKDTGLKDVAKDLAAVTSPKSMGLDAVKSAADKFEKWDPIKNAAKVAKAATQGEAAADSADMALEARTTLAMSSMTPASSLTSVADLKAADAKTEDAEPSIMGPETRKLYDKQAAKAAVMAESAAKLKAIDEAEGLPPVATKPKGKPRATKVAVPETDSTSVKTVRAKKSAEPAPESAPELSAEPAKAPRKTKPVKADIA